MIDLDTLKANLRIDDVLAYLDLEQPRRAGQARVIRCPFHYDRTPSLKIFKDKRAPDEDTWFCFSCGKGGSIIQLVMAVKGVDFSDAVSELAKLAGEDVTFSAPRERRPEEILQEVEELAHADIVEAVRAKRKLYSADFRQEVFEEYDEILRGYSAGEIEATEATKKLLAWRAHWKRELS